MSRQWNGENLRLAINTWLTFESLCNRSNLFSEGYLRKPLGEYLSANCNMDIISEHNHPLLADDGVGRPPQIDFVVKRKDGTFDAAIELKWFKNVNSTLEIKRIFSDLLRLRLLLENSMFSTANSFFIISMEKKLLEDFKALQIRGNKKSFYYKVLCSKKQKLINIHDEYFRKIAIDRRLRNALQNNKVHQFGIKKVFLGTTLSCCTGLWEVTLPPA